MGNGKNRCFAADILVNTIVTSPNFLIADILKIETLWIQSPAEYAKNRARGNRKTLKWLKMITKCNFRTSKLESHEEYLIYRTYFVK